MRSQWRNRLIAWCFLLLLELPVLRQGFRRVGKGISSHAESTCEVERIPSGTRAGRRRGFRDG